MTSNAYFQKIRDLVAKDNLDGAIQLLRKLLKNTPRLDEAILQSTRWNDIKKQIRSGLIDHESAQITKNQIRAGILELVSDMEAEAKEATINEEVEQYIHSISGKNIVQGSNIQAGGSIHIGDQNITESKTSRNIRLFLFVLVPLLAISVAVLYFQYRSAQHPLRLDVVLDNQTPNQHLPFENGRIILIKDTPIDTQYTTSEATFKSIPANLRNQTVTLRFEAKGFETIAKSFTLDKPSVTLPIRRDDTYQKLSGTVVDEEGLPIENAEVLLEDLSLSTTTSAQGTFSFSIPTTQQRLKHRLKVIKEGYELKDREEPVNKDRSARILLIKVVQK